MMKSATVSLEAIKLKLIESNTLPGARSNEVLLSKEAIKYLIKALEYADKAFASEIEGVLTKVGSVAVPELIRGLSDSNNTVKSTCAMALIRQGQPVTEAVKHFYLRCANKPHLSWIPEFILAELGEDIPVIDVASPVISLEKVG